MLKDRLVTAAALVALILASLRWAPVPLLAAVFLLFVIGAAWEWTLLIGWRRQPLRVGYVVGLVAIALAAEAAGVRLAAGSWFGFAVLGWWLLVSAVVAAYHFGRLPASSGIVVSAAGGVLMIVPAWLALVELASDDRFMLATLFALIWLADGAAYAVGSGWGRHRLAPRISPGKTWEGVAAALAAALAVAVVSAVLSGRPTVEWGGLIALGCATVCAAVVGDLAESLAKRQRGVKDSGAALPGHGGVLDRVDSLLAAAPVFAFGLKVVI